MKPKTRARLAALKTRIVLADGHSAGLLGRIEAIESRLTALEIRTAEAAETAEAAYKLAERPPASKRHRAPIAPDLA